MKHDILITTTNSIEGADIEKYIEIISTNVVIGTNFFSDFGASLTDFFGGFSDTYQNKLLDIYNIAIDNLKKKAKNIGANSIIGLKIDFDEISGKGKSMFMISALGTAVVVKYKTNNITNIKDENLSNLTISYHDLNNEVTRLQIIEKIKNKILPTQEDWYFLLNNPIVEITDFLLDVYISIDPLNIDNKSQIQKNLFENIPLYIKLIDKDVSLNLLYEKIEKNSKTIVELLMKNRLFNTEKIKGLIRNGYLISAVECLKIDKDNYVDTDINEMKELILLFENLPDLGKIELSKGILSKSSEIYICPNKHKNNLNEKFCKHKSEDYVLDCQQNIKGITEIQTKDIEVFKLKTNTLEKLICQN